MMLPAQAEIPPFEIRVSAGLSDEEWEELMTLLHEHVEVRARQTHRSGALTWEVIKVVLKEGAEISRNVGLISGGVVGAAKLCELGHKIWQLLQKTRKPIQAELRIDETTLTLDEPPKVAEVEARLRRGDRKQG